MSGSLPSFFPQSPPRSGSPQFDLPWSAALHPTLTQSQSSQSQSSQSQSSQSQSSQSQSSQSQSSQSQSSQSQSSQSQSSQSQSSQSQSSQSQSSQLESIQPESAQSHAVKSDASQPNAAKASAAKSRPKVIFLDAVGTLFGVRGSVGQVYADLARQFGVIADPEVVNQAFYHSFKMSRPMAFADVGAGAVPLFEYVWWEAIATQTFQLAGVLDQFKHFPDFFEVLYKYFETADPWFIYEDVRESLDRWYDQGIELGVLSNFDTRLYKVLLALGLSDYFSSITISTEAGAAKPDPVIFKTALEKHNCLPEQAWHVGDSYKEDYEGAKAVGIHAIWLKRD